jgi:hypothetical protein
LVTFLGEARKVTPCAGEAQPRQQAKPAPDYFHKYQKNN